MLVNLPWVNILYLTGSVDKRTVEKYERSQRCWTKVGICLGSWTPTKKETMVKPLKLVKPILKPIKRYTILDAPGHKMYVSEMIGGASQADVGILVISARKVNTKLGSKKVVKPEHALLAKTQGVNKIIVVVNKMDDSTVGWSKERYQECTTKLVLS